MNRNGFRAPYAIGKVSESVIRELLGVFDSQEMFISNHASPITPANRKGAHEVVSLAKDGKGVTFERPTGANTLSASGQANWDLLAGTLRSLAKSAATESTRILCFNHHCVTAMQTVLEDEHQEGLPDEVRMVWAPYSEFLVGVELDEQDARLAALANAGFNTVCLNTYWRGYTTYPDSQYRLQFGLGHTRAKVVDTLVAGIHSKRMRAEAWPEYGFYASYNKGTTETSGFLAANQHLAAVDKEGRDYFFNPQYGYFKALCPTNPESHKQLIGLYSEMLEKYPFDGINLDRIRFPNADFCHCDYCRKRFAEDTGTSLTVFAEGSAEWTTWMEWRKARVTDFMRSFSKEIRAKFPGRTITACAVPPEEMDAKGQDWPAWVEEDLVDAVVPLLYSGSDKAAGMAAIQKLVPDQSRVIYGLLPWEGVGDDICKMRQAGGRGYAVWHIGTLTPAARDAFEEANTPFGPGPSTLAKPR